MQTIVERKKLEEDEQIEIEVQKKQLEWRKVQICAKQCLINLSHEKLDPCTMFRGVGDVHERSIVCERALQYSILSLWINSIFL